MALVVLKHRYGTDWEPWFGESIWEDEDALADEIRDWPEFKEAKGIVRLFIKRLDSRIAKEQEEYYREQARKEAAQRADAEAAEGTDTSAGDRVAEV